MDKIDPEARAKNFYAQPVSALLDEDPGRTQVQETDDIREVLERFRARAPAVVVVDNSRRPKGIFTTRAVNGLTEAYRKNPNVKIIDRLDLMTKQPVVCTSSTSVGRALDKIAHFGFKSGIPVVDSGGAYLGYLSTPSVLAELNDLRRTL